MSAQSLPAQTKQHLQARIAELETRLSEAEDTLRAIREGEVDAVIVSGSKGEQIFSLSDSESIYRMMVETMAEVGLAVTPEGLILFANDCLGRTLQRPLQQIVGQPVENIVDPRDHNRLKSLMTAVQECAADCRLTLRAADGHAIPVYMWAHRLERADGATVCMVGVDLTQLEASREIIQHLEEQHRALQRSEQRLALATSATRIGMFEWDVDEGRMLWTQAVEGILGYSPAISATSTTITTTTTEHNYSEWENRLHPKDLPVLMEAIRRHMLDRRPFEEQYRILWPDASAHWVETRGVFLHDGKGRAVRMLGVLMDITERKRLEQQLQEMNETLERRVTERTAEVQQKALQLRALAADLSHTEQRERKRLAQILHDHIQQLLVAARMQVEWLKRDNNPERRQAAAQGVDEILKEALDASRSLTVELSPPALHSAGLIGALNWLASVMRGKNHFTVRLRSDNKAEPPTEEMRFLIFECARELLFNAVKHSGVFEALATLVRTRDGQIRLIISDEGKGFDLDVVNKRRADEATFGLFSIQQRLAHIGGEMEIATAPGKGTRITLTIPVSDAEPLPEERDETAPKQEETGKFSVRKTTARRRVLIVDDHKIVREGLVGLMQLEPDIEVVGQAGDGAQAIELAEKLQPDVIIMDINLGDGMNGVEATKRILAAKPDIKVIGLSMHTDNDVVTALHDAGAVAYLTKGGPSEDLIAAMRAACR